jgi:hypothetical protein
MEKPQDKKDAVRVAKESGNYKSVTEGVSALDEALDSVKISVKAVMRDGEHSDPKIAFHAAWKEISYGITFVAASPSDRAEFGKGTFRVKKGEMHDYEFIAKLDPKGMKLYFVDQDHYRDTDEVKWQEPIKLTRLIIYSKDLLEESFGGTLDSAEFDSIFINPLRSNEQVLDGAWINPIERKPVQKTLGYLISVAPKNADIFMDGSAYKLSDMPKKQEQEKLLMDFIYPDGADLVARFVSTKGARHFQCQIPAKNVGVTDKDPNTSKQLDAASGAAYNDAVDAIFATAQVDDGHNGDTAKVGLAFLDGKLVEVTKTGMYKSHLVAKDATDAWNKAKADKRYEDLKAVITGSKIFDYAGQPRDTDGTYASGKQGSIKAKAQHVRFAVKRAFSNPFRR